MNLKKIKKLYKDSINPYIELLVIGKKIQIAIIFGMSLITSITKILGDKMTWFLLFISWTSIFLMAQVIYSLRRITRIQGRALRRSESAKNKLLVLQEKKVQSKIKTPPENYAYYAYGYYWNERRQPLCKNCYLPMEFYASPRYPEYKELLRCHNCPAEYKKIRILGTEGRYISEDMADADPLLNP
jgi:hypothetical protein